MRNLKLAFRTLFKTPFVTAVAVLSLALGIGANAAIFSLFDQMLLQPLPVLDPGRLVNLGAPGPKPGSQSCSQAGDCDVVFSYPMFRDLERQQTVLSGLAAHRDFGVNLSYHEQPLSGRGTLVSGSYFPDARRQAGAGPPDRAVRRRGHRRRLRGGPELQLLGVAAGSRSVGGGRDDRGQRPLAGDHRRRARAASTARSWGRGRWSSCRSPCARRCPTCSRSSRTGAATGSTCSAASSRACRWSRPRTGLNAVYRPIITDVEAPLQQGMSEQTMATLQDQGDRRRAGRAGQSSVHKEARTPLLMLFSVTGIVLLIACANIANLLLARGAGRATEMGVRLALGASRRQLLTQLLTESVLLALMGGVASLLVARWTLAAHRAPAPARRADHAALRAAALGDPLHRARSPSPPGSCSACSPPCTAPGPTWSPRSAPTRARSRARGAPPASGPPWSRCRSRWRWRCSSPPGSS